MPSNAVRSTEAPRMRSSYLGGDGGGGLPGGFVTNPGCVAAAEVSSLVALVSLYPSTVAAEFTLGSLTVCDPRLPVDHPYRWAVRAANAANTVTRDAAEAVPPLVEVSYETFDVGTEADGASSSVSARLRPTRVVFLNRLVTECRAFVTGLVDGIGEADEGGKESAPAKAADGEVGGSNPGRGGGEVNAVRLDVALEAPTIVVPRSTGDTSLALELDMGSLAAKNTLEKTTSSSQVVDRLAVGLSGVRVDVVRNGDDDGGTTGRGGTGRGVTGVTDRTPLVREPASIDAVVWRVLADSSPQKPSPHENAQSAAHPRVRTSDLPVVVSDDDPDIALEVDVAPLRLDLSAEDYQLLSTCFSDNLTRDAPAEIPKTTNPVDKRALSNARRRVSDTVYGRHTRRTTTYATAQSGFGVDAGAQLLTLEEDAEEPDKEQHHEEPDDEAPFDQRRRLGRGTAALRRLPDHQLL